MKGMCPKCKGKGRIDCTVRKGKGKIRVQSIDRNSEQKWEPCPDYECRGPGKVTCPSCQGSGWL